MGINTNLQNIETKLTNLKTNLDGYLVNKGAAAGSTLTQSIDNVDTIQTGGGGPVKLPNGTKFGKSTFTEIPSNYDFSEITDFVNMFNECSNLTSIPLLDTSHVTDTNSMFNGCSNLTSIPLLDTSQVTKMRNMFAGCSNLTSIPLLDTSQVTDISGMFIDCSNLTTAPQLDTHSATDMAYMFQRCNITTCPRLDTQNVTNMYNMFRYCGNLTTVTLLDVRNLIRSSSIFYADNNLSFINIINLGTKSEFTNVSFSSTIWGDDTKVAGSKQSLIDSLITNSFDRATAGYAPCTLTLSEQTKGYLTEEEKTAITAKGFTIA